MNRLEYLKHCVNNKGYYSKACLQAMIAIQFEDPDSSGLFKKEPFAIYVEGGKFFTLIDGEPVHVEGKVDQPLFRMDDIITLPGDFHEWFKGVSYETTFGLFLFNLVLFWEPFKGVVGYVNREFTKNLIEDLLNDIMVDDPAEGETVPEGKASASDCMKFTENCYFLEGLGTHFTKPGGEDILTVDPSITKFLDEQFKLHKDNLNDPVVFQSIVKQAIKMDEELMLNGPSKNFFINKKFIHTARMRMFLAFGIEPNGAGDGWVALPRSLNAGIDPETIVATINTAVVGSYSRSMATGDGGSRVKEMLRLVGRSLVVFEDCKSPVGEAVHLTEGNLKGWIGSYHLVNKEAILLTKENISKLVGKVVNIRVPQFCMTPAPNYCHICCGSKLGKYGTRLSAEVTLIPTQSMLQSMKAAHSASVDLTYLDLDIAIKD